MGTRAVHFVGIDTSGSRVHELFPRWMEALGSEACVHSVDLPSDASPKQYRSLVESISTDGDVLGAVITSHKLGVFAACTDLFAEVDPFAALTHETNCLHKTARGLAAAACDPLAVRAVLNESVGNPEDVLCLGAGGAATAIAFSLLTGEVPPRRAIFTDVQPDRLQTLNATLNQLGRITTRLEFLSASETEAVLASLPSGSLVVNATGLGKDRVGSPISDDVLFPIDGVVWELNYRGERPFLAQAHSQERERCLHVHDGWLYFLHGWFQALAPILGFNPHSDAFDRLYNASA